MRQPWAQQQKLSPTTSENIHKLQIINLIVICKTQKHIREETILRWRKTVKPDKSITYTYVKVGTES